MARRLAKRYVAVPFDGPTLAVFLNNTGRAAAWRALLNPEAVIHIMDGTHSELVHEPALTQWTKVLQEQLDHASGPGASLPVQVVANIAAV